MKYKSCSGNRNDERLKMHIQKKTIRAIMEIATGILAIIVIYFVIRQVSMRYSHNATSATDTAEAEKRTEFPEESINITINGTQYKFLHNVRTYLFLGTDASGNEEGVGDDYQGAMADVLMLVVIDETEQSYGILQLNRDTITDVPMLQADGSAYASADMQLCTAHWYGKDKAASCENTVNTVSELLGGIPIDGYYALQMQAMGLLNHDVGGVTVTLEDDMTELDPQMKKGATLTLTDHQAELLIQSRYAMKDDRNTERMRRQQIFMRAFLKKIKEKNAEDINATIDIYDSLRPYATENINMNELTSLLKKTQGYTDKGIFTMDGENKIGEKLHDGKKHWEFYMDEDSLESVMKELYPLQKKDEEMNQ